MTDETRTPIRTGLIGYGFAGKTFHAPLISAVSGLALTAISSSKPDAVKADFPAATVYADPMALIESDVDLVVIASPNDTHAPLAEAALKAGKHVVVDKPFTLTLAEARHLGAVAKAQKRLLSVFHNRRFDSDFLGVKGVIESGQLGRVTHFESHFDRFRPMVRDRWREHDIPGGGLWFDLGPHIIDQALQLFGLPEQVTATIATQRTGGQAADYAHCILHYGSMRAVLHASMLVAGGTHRFTVHGDGGSLIKPTLDGQETQLLAGLRPRDAAWGVDTEAMTLFTQEGARALPTPRGDQSRYYALIADAIKVDSRNPVTPLQALAVMAVIEAAEISSRERRSVEPDLSDVEKAAFRNGDQ